MEEYSDDKLFEIKAKVSGWNVDFEKSAGYTGLTSSQQEEAGFI